MTLPPEIQEIIDRPRTDRFNKVLAVGFSALEEKDLQLAKAAAEHIISRADSGSGDLVRGLFLLYSIHKEEGDTKRSSEIMARICKGEF